MMMMRHLTRVLFVVALIGCAGGVIVHVASMAGVTTPFERVLPVLGPGIFVVWAPTIFVMNRQTRDLKQKDIWRAALRGCPTWMRRTVWIIFGYSWLGFFLIPFLLGGGIDSELNKIREMSAVFLAFYVIAVAVTFSSLHSERSDSTR